MQNISRTDCESLHTNLAWQQDLTALVVRPEDLAVRQHRKKSWWQ